MLRQISNLKHAIALLLHPQQLRELQDGGGAGEADAKHARNARSKDVQRDESDSHDTGWWLLHIDQDKILYEDADNTTTTSSGSSWRTRSNVGHVVFTNHEAIPVAQESQDPFIDCIWFTLNQNSVPFMAYGNGKPALRISPGVEPDGVHRFKGYQGSAITLPIGTTAGGTEEQPVLLHYPYSSFMMWAAKFRLYGAFSNYWLDEENCPDMLVFMLESRDVIQAAIARDDWTNAKHFSKRGFLARQQSNKVWTLA
jgi:hypothetical protein